MTAVDHQVKRIIKQLTLVQAIIAGTDSHNIWNAIDTLEGFVSDLRIPVERAIKKGKEVVSK